MASVSSLAPWVPGGGGSLRICSRKERERGFPDVAVIEDCIKSYTVFAVNAQTTNYLLYLDPAEVRLQDGPEPRPAHRGSSSYQQAPVYSSGWGDRPALSQLGAKVGLHTKASLQHARVRYLYLESLSLFIYSLGDCWPASTRG